MSEFDGILHRVMKPARYTGGEWNSVVKDWHTVNVKVALAYPDVYEIGMSNVGLAILYDLLNKRDDVLAERVYAPWVDMAYELRNENKPLFSLESKQPLNTFDIIGFSLAHELTYTNLLNMLDLAQIPVLVNERNDTCPLIIAGGVCGLNPEPMVDFIDLFVLGDGEEVMLELVDIYKRWKCSGMNGGKKELLRLAADLDGIYIPSLYKDSYNPDGTLSSLEPLCPEAKPVIRRRIVSELPQMPLKPVVPYLQLVHDRAVVEIQRGCTRGCRFCQAGIVYRPSRQRSQKEIIETAGELVANCGYDEISLLSLSSSDYPEIEKLVSILTTRYRQKRINVSLPSLRLDSFSISLADALWGRKKSGFTFAPEAGNERLRYAINKRLSDESMMKTIEMILSKGDANLKLYFMVGLPGETMDDVRSIVDLVGRIRQMRGPSRKRVNVKVNVSTFVPKPHTPFQWVSQDDERQLSAKHDVLRSGMKKIGAALSWHDPQSSLLEAILSRGDRRIGKAIYKAWQKGCSFDSWSEHFNYERWREAFIECDIDPAFYANRERSLDELLPWAHIDVGVRPSFLKREYERSLSGQETIDCQREHCISCGLERSVDACKERCLALSITTADVPVEEEGN